VSKELKPRNATFLLSIPNPENSHNYEIRNIQWIVCVEDNFARLVPALAFYGSDD